MNDLLNTIFGLRGVGFGDEGVMLEFARPLAAWAWFMAILFAGALAWWSYRRMDGSAATRSGLAALRALALLLLVLLISGPQLVRPNDRVEKDWVLILVDRSASMNIADVENAPGAAAAARTSREAQFRAALNAAWPAISPMVGDRTVVWLGFDGGIYDLQQVQNEAGEMTSIEPGAPTGRRTSLGASLNQALARAAARPVSGVVIFSDGRSVDEPTRQAMRRLQAERIPVVTIPLGSADPMADLAIMRTEAPGLAFLEDHIPVSVEVERLGGTPGAARGRIELVDRTTGRILEERELPGPDQWEDDRTRIILTTRPLRAGRQSWQIRLIPDTPDLIEENNLGEVALEVVDRPVRIVYFDGYPRWEYRYLKDLLVRETSIQSAVQLLASNRQYIQDGEVFIDALPRSPEEWGRFDVIIIGDVLPNVFSREQLEQIREHVSLRGGGLLWIGGESATPGAWRDTPLADLLPFSIARSGSSAGGETIRAWGTPVIMVPTAAAARLNLLQLTDDPENPWPATLVDPNTGWSQMQWAQRIDPDSIKPTAEILARFIPSSIARERLRTPAPDAPVNPAAAEVTQSPAVLSMRYGAGRVLYVATDEVWRWRYARGETLPERFWLPLLRLQGRESLARTARPGVLEVSPRRPEVQQPVRIAVHLLDQSLLDIAPAQTTVRIRSLDDPSAPQTELTLSPEQAAESRAGVRAARSFASIWIPSDPGRYRIEPADPLLSGLGLGVDTEVALPEDELRHPETDHALLARLSEQTGGQVLPVARLPELPTLLPKREVHIAGTPDIETLWDKPLFFILLLTLLAAEWIGRRLLRLA